MIEVTVLEYLEEALDGIPVYMEKPADLPLTYVILEKTGSSRENHVSTATFAVQSYAPSLYDAAELNEVVKAAFDDIISLDEIGGVRLNSDYSMIDTQTKAYRYQAIYVVTYV